MPKFSSLKEELNLQDGLIGASFQVNPQWVLRTDFALGKSPTTNADRTVRIPVGNRKTLTFVADWQASDNLTLDMAYAYIRETAAGSNTALKPAYRAKYRNNAHDFTGQATWRF